MAKPLRFAMEWNATICFILPLWIISFHAIYTEYLRLELNNANWHIALDHIGNKIVKDRECSLLTSMGEMSKRVFSNIENWEHLKESSVPKKTSHSFMQLFFDLLWNVRFQTGVLYH